MTLSLFLFPTQQTNKPKKYFSLLFVETLHKFTNDRISKKIIMMHIWIVFKTKLKGQQKTCSGGKTRNFSFLFCSFLHSTKSIWKKQTHHGTIWESKEAFPHQLLWMKDTESVFTVFRLRTTPFLLSLVPLFLLIYCFPFFTMKIMQCIKRSECFSILWWRESISQRKKQNFLSLNRIMYFSSFFIIRHTFPSLFTYSSLISFEHSLFPQRIDTFPFTFIFSFHTQHIVDIWFCEQKWKREMREWRNNQKKCVSYYVRDWNEKEVWFWILNSEWRTLKSFTFLIS